MRFCARRLVLVFGALTVLVSSHLSFVKAQLPKVDDERLGVDSLKLHDGTRLYGFALGYDRDAQQRTLRFSVARDWLESTHPKLAEEVRQEELDNLEAAREQFVTRVERWIQQRSTEVGFTNVLRMDLAKFQKQSDAPQDAQETRFAVLEIDENEVRSLRIAETRDRKIAGLSYMQGLDNVVSTPASMLEKQLVAQGVNMAQAMVDLSSDLPKFERMSDKQWSAKKALFEYQYREPLEYQGTGGMLLRKSDEPADLAQLMQALTGPLGSGGGSIAQIGAELGLPEFQQFQKKAESTDWWREIAKEASEDGFLGFVVYRLKQNALSSKVSVETTFLAKGDTGSDGDWIPVYQMTTSVDARAKNAEMQKRIDRIQQDPQVAQVTELLGSLGLGDGAQLERALQQGAATEQALETAKREFSQFVNTYGDDITQPRVPLP